mgnify:CR=1 FL=1
MHDADEAEFGKDAARLFAQADQLAAMIRARKRRDFQAWLLIGKALTHAKAQLVARHGGSLRNPGRPWVLWLQAHPGLAAISESDRSSACWLWDHHEEIIAWRDQLPEAVRETLSHPHSNRLAYQRHLRMLVAVPGQKHATKPDPRSQVVRLEKIVADMAERFSEAGAEIAALRERVATLEAVATGAVVQRTEARRAARAA